MVSWRFKLIFAAFIMSRILGVLPNRLWSHWKRYAYYSDIQVIKAFANTGVELMIGVQHSDLIAFSQVQSNADTWLQNHVVPYYPTTKITYITVGSEVALVSNNVSALVLPAMQNVFTALKKAGLHRKIKVSTTHAVDVLSNSFPPSSRAFSSTKFLKPILEFLAENQSPFMVDIYPYFNYEANPAATSINYYLLFQSSPEVNDVNTGLNYTNLFDALIDSFYFALNTLNFSTIKVMVTETGWPSKGSTNERAATINNANTYNTNLIRYIINNTGTPAKPNEELDVYIFSLFNENKRPGAESERNWGLFYADGTSVYNLDFMIEANATRPTWCIGNSNANKEDMKNALNWACGPSGNVDCTAIQPSQPCFEPNTLLSHASYVFNSYYQQNGGTYVSCSFDGTSIRVTKDPSKFLYSPLYVSAMTTAVIIPDDSRKLH